MDIEKYESASYILSQIKDYQEECDKLTTANYIRFQMLEIGNNGDTVLNIHNCYGEIAEAYKRFIGEVRDFYTHRIEALQKELKAL